MAAVSIDTALTATAGGTRTVARTTNIDTALTAIANPAPATTKTVTMGTALRAVATTTPVFNQALSIKTSLKVTAGRKPTLFPPIEYFTVVADLVAIVTDYVDIGADPDQQPISASVKFIPRLGVGQIIWIPGQGVALAPIRARFDPDGVLRTIQGGTGVELVANTPVLGLPELIWDVVFTNVIYDRNDQLIAPFAFTAPTTGGGVLDLSTVTKLTPQPGL